MVGGLCGVVVRRGETYQQAPGERTKDLLIGGIALVYAVWLLYAGGLKYLLLSALLYAPGVILFAKAVHEQGNAIVHGYREGHFHLCHRWCGAGGLWVVQRLAEPVRSLLAYQPPYDWPAMLGFLSARAIIGLEIVVDGVYSRSIGLNGVYGTFSIRPAQSDALELTPGLSGRVRPCLRSLRELRRMFDLDADLSTIHRHLAVDPLMARLIAERPGLRVPGAWDGLELAIRAVLGQQITVAAAIRLAGKLVAQYGAPLQSAAGGVDPCVS